HGPFSHLFEKFLHTFPDKATYKHETASVKMFDHLVKENKLENDFAVWNLNKDDIKFIKNLIDSSSKTNIAEQVRKLILNASQTTIGHLKTTNILYINNSEDDRVKEKPFLFEIVANKRNGIDVDKWDYFARDCYHLGITSHFDLHRFMKLCRVVDVDGEKQICYRDKEMDNIYDMYHTRSMLHRRAYKHKTTMIIEYMIDEAFKLANDYILTKGKTGYRISECIDDLDAYTKLTDYLYHRILYSTEDDLSQAREILERIESRNLYRFIGEAKYKQQQQQPKSITQASDKIPGMISDIVKCDESNVIKDADIVLLSMTIDYGKKDKNPVDDVKFYKKKDPEKASSIDKNQ
ncbi:hypothetical protein LSH36_61g13000, partial [Paralvinella palmiformis]